LSQNDLRLHFGLGQEEKIENVEVRWSDGQTETVTNVTPNRILTITKNKGITSSSDYQKLQTEEVKQK
jgi:hypothetical protein